MAGTEADTGLQARRDEIETLKTVIGWSWPTVGERLGLTASQIIAVKTCKRAVPDADLAWLRKVAGAIEAMPRPDVVVESSAGETGEGLTMRSMTPIGPQRHPPDAALADSYVEFSAPLNAGFANNVTPALAIAETYHGLPAGNLTEEQREGAAWALGEVTRVLGLTDAVKELLRQLAGAPEPGPVPPVPELEGLRQPF